MDTPATNTNAPHPPRADQRLGSRLRHILLAFVLFCLAWGPLHFVSDSPAQWLAATSAHPALGITLTALNLAGLVAILAVLGGCLALVLAVCGQAIARRDGGLLLLAAIPPLAALLAIAATVLLAPAAHLFQGGPRIALTPEAQAVRAGLALGIALMCGGSVVALWRAVARTDLGQRTTRLLYVLAGLASGAMIVGGIAGGGTIALVVLQAQALGTWPPLEALTFAFLVGALVLSCGAFWRRHAPGIVV